jgi:hypothetical protein
LNEKDGDGETAQGSNPPALNEQNQPADDGRKRKKKRSARGWLRYRGREINFLFNAVVATFAIVVGVETCSQLGLTQKALDETRESNDLTRESIASGDASEQRQLRAYVAVTSLNYAGVIESRVHFKVTIANHGRTPALHFRIASDVAGTAVPPDTIYDRQGTCPQDLDGQAGGGVYLPFKEYVTEAWSGLIGPEQDDVAGAITHGGLITYAHGCLWYDDIFGVQHAGMFCGSYDPHRGTVDNCPAGNWMD